MVVKAIFIRKMYLHIETYNARGEYSPLIYELEEGEIGGILRCVIPDGVLLVFGDGRFNVTIREGCEIDSPMVNTDREIHIYGLFNISIEILIKEGKLEFCYRGTDYGTGNLIMGKEEFLVYL